MAELTEQSLYHRLGGYEAIAAATDDLLARLQGDPRLRDYWKGASTHNQHKARQLIDDSDWEAFMRHAAATLDHFLVASPEKDEVLAFFARLKTEIVEGE